MRDDQAILSGLWYFACPSKDLARGALLRRIFWGEPVVLGRTKAGEVFALRDVCPHRAAPLSAGRIIEEGEDPPRIECPYHGWRIGARDGVCAAIPALHSESAFDPSPITVRGFPLHEANGLVWIFRPDESRAAQNAVPAGAPPSAGLPPSFRPKMVTVALAEGPYDEAVIGLVDPAHTPFVHRQWWWREGAGLKDKVKNFEPVELGFKMPAHRPSSNSRIYKMLGGAPTTEIEFRLPGIRLETIRTARRTILGLTAITPEEDGRARITHMIYWDMPILTLLKPVLEGMSASFLAQDGAMLREQNKNLSRMQTAPLYVGDPDEPAKWYYRLKRAWMERPPSGAFVNPLSSATLRWRT